MSYQQTLHNSQWSESLIHVMYHLGVRHFCVAPGSRNASLSLALFKLSQELKNICIHTHFDERGLGFFALGLAKVQGQPVCVLTTSGTAVANLHPAVVEAYETAVPLLLLSADRPDRLLGCGANQAIQQKHLFGDNSVLSVNLTLPETHDDLNEQITAFLRQYAHLKTLGPVQINCQFDEPLYEVVPSLQLDWQQLNNIARTVPSAEIEPAWLQLIAAAQAPVVVLGQLTPSQKAQLLPWIKTLKCPVIADIASQFRGLDDRHILHYADLLLMNQHFVEPLTPDVVIQFGGRMVSKRIGQFLADIQVSYFLFCEDDQPLDPSRHAQQTTIRFHQLADRLPALQHQHIESLCQLHQQFSDWLQDRLGQQWHEAGIARTLMAHMNERSAILAGNSLSIRMLDSYGQFNTADIDVYSNRGASGIDGLIATGAALASGDYQQLYMLLGDTAFLHDLNSLALVAKMPKPITIVVLNNNGGGIFDLLPASQQSSYQQMFLMPHGLSFQHAAAQFKLDHRHIRDLPELEQALALTGQQQRSIVLECHISEGTTRLKQLLEQIRLLGLFCECL